MPDMSAAEVLVPLLASSALAPIVAALAISLQLAPTPPPPPAPPPTSTSPSLSGKLALASQRHRAGDYVTAADLAFAVATGPASADVAAAEFALVKALVRLELPAAAKRWALPIADPERAHPMRRAVLPWLVAIARDLEPDPQLLAAVATYGDDDLNDPRFDRVRGDLSAMIGRARYQAGDLEAALVALTAVPDGADDYVASQFLAGVAQTRLGAAQPAVAAFKNVLRTNARDQDARTPRANARLDRYAYRRSRLRERDRDRGIARLQRRMARRGVTSIDLDRFEEHRRLDEMTSLSMAYVFYQAGQLQTASRYFRRVPQSSPYWLDAIFGDAWAEFSAAYVDADHANAHYQRVLGHVHTMRAPFFPYRLYPELPLLAAMTYYYNCRYGSASRALDDFDQQYVATRTRLKAFLAAHPEDFDLAEVLGAIQRGEADGLDDATLRVVAGLLHDRALARQHARIARIESERQTVTELDLRGSVAEMVHEEIDLAASRAKEESGAAVRTRLVSAVEEINRFERQALAIRYELAPKLVQHPGPPSAATRARPDVKTDLYEYNGEYWQDELGRYRVEITSQCRAED